MGIRIAARSAGFLGGIFVGCAMVASCNGIELAGAPGVAVAIGELTPTTVWLHEPGAAGTDTFIDSFDPNGANGGDPAIEVVDYHSAYGIVRLDPDHIRGAVTPGNMLLGATLELYATSVAVTSGSLPATFAAATSMQQWSQNGATWNCRDDFDPGDGLLDCVSGGGWSPSPSSLPAISTATVSAPGWVSFNVTADVRTLLEQPTATHQGWFIRPVLGNALFVSTEDTTSPNRPRLRIYQAPSGYIPEEPVPGTATAPPLLDRSAPTHTYDAMGWLLDPTRGLQWASRRGSWIQIALRSCAAV